MSLELTPELIRLLKGNFLLEALDASELAGLISTTTIEHTPAGEAIVKEGERASTVHVVLEGGVNVLKGQGQFLAFLGPGGFFGEMGLFIPESVRTATCQAALDTRCLVISHDDVHRFCAAWPASGIKVYRAIIRALAERLQATSHDLATLMAAQVKNQSEVSDAVARARQKLASKQQTAPPINEEPSPCDT